MTRATPGYQVYKIIIQRIMINMMNNKIDISKTLLANITVSFENLLFKKMTKHPLISFGPIRIAMNIRRIKFTNSFFREVYTRFLGHRMSIEAFFHRFAITFTGTMDTASLGKFSRPYLKYLMTVFTCSINFIRSVSVSIIRVTRKRAKSLRSPLIRNIEFFFAPLAAFIYYHLRLRYYTSSSIENQI